MKRTIGIEREWFILREGKIVPLIGILLPQLQMISKEINGHNTSEDDLIHPELINLPKPFKSIADKDVFGFELFAGQVEDRTHIHKAIEDVIANLGANEKILVFIGRKLGLEFKCVDFVPEEELGTLVVNPFDERHQEIWSKLEHHRKVGASQVAAIHVHVGVTEDEVVRVLNYCRPGVINYLAAMGDFSNGQRLAGYRVMAGVYGDPPIMDSFEDTLRYIERKGGERDVWDMVRYKPRTKTIEFRMFGATNNYVKIREFIAASLDIVDQAVRH
ncbi:MAG: glutamate-cysteine ligase family protein [Candidatus Komeilibacteria bacterium]